MWAELIFSLFIQSHNWSRDIMSNIDCFIITYYAYAVHNISEPQYTLQDKRCDWIIKCIFMPHPHSVATHWYSVTWDICSLSAFSSDVPSGSVAGRAPITPHRSSIREEDLSSALPSIAQISARPPRSRSRMSFANNIAFTNKNILHFHYSCESISLWDYWIQKKKITLQC